MKTTKEKTEKTRVLKKLVKAWRAHQETKDKAKVLLSRNPELKERRSSPG